MGFAYKMLDTGEARNAFRDTYYPTVIRSAISLTKSRVQAGRLTEALFQRMNARYENAPLPAAIELQLLSQLNLLLAQGACRREDASLDDVFAADKPYELQTDDCTDFTDKSKKTPPPDQQADGRQDGKPGVFSLEATHRGASDAVGAEANGPEAAAAPVPDAREAPKTTPKASNDSGCAAVSPAARLIIRPRTRARAQQAAVPPGFPWQYGMPAQPGEQPYYTQAVPIMMVPVYPMQMQGMAGMPLTGMPLTGMPMAVAAPQTAAPDASSEASVGGEPPKRREDYDPALTELWTPMAEEAAARQASPADNAAPVRAPAPPAASQTDEEASRRSVPLTILNTLLLIVALASVAFLLMQLKVLPRFFK